MKGPTTTAILLLLCCLTFVKAHGSKHEELEKLLLSIPDPKRLKSVLYHLTQKSHVTATRGDWENAHYVRDTLKSYGIDNAAIEAVPVMMSYPLDRPQLSTSFGFHAKLSEDALPQDGTSGTTEWRNHTFLAYSPSGQVTAPLVYANFGRPQDFDALEKMGVSVQDKVVIMRYGKCFRGLKVMNAEERGAIGSIIFSDPQQDGFSQGPTYDNNGPWRPPSGVQRGSVQFNSKCAGDPWRMYLNQSYLNHSNHRSHTATTKIDNSNTIVKDLCGYNTSELVPSHVALPLSYQDAHPLLQQLGGKSAPSNFQGGLPFSYTVGPSDWTVTLKTNHSFFPKKIPNVIATIHAEQDDADDSTTTTTKEKTPTVIIGNHRDAWVFGAVDPNSGTTALLEVARALQVLKQQGGWKPKRDIILASWSGEEYGLLGSTAFAELYQKENDESAITYLNVDCAVTGNVSLNVSATHSLTTLFRQAAEQVPAPPKQSQQQESSDGSRSMADITVWNQKIDTLGSGSDYTAFLDRFGISSLDMSFKGDYGVYHSVYDSFSWMEQQGDPTFEIHQAMTRLWALMTFRLASSEILPIYMSPQASQMLEDSSKLKAPLTILFDKNAKVLEEYTKLQEAVDSFKRAAEAIDKEHAQYDEQPTAAASHMNQQSLSADINRRLTFVERRFLGPGLPRRKWFRHVLQAPGFYLGYGSQAFPGIATAIQENDADMAIQELSIAANTVGKAARFLLGKEQKESN